MQCVILAAGKGTRMLPLTESIPKPLVNVCEQPLITHVIDALPTIITEIIIVVSYKADLIQTFLNDNYPNKHITYVHQDNPKGGTGEALMLTKSIITDRFLFMYADDIHGAPALQTAVTYDSALLAATTDHPEDFGVITTNDDGTLAALIEKPKNPMSNLVNVGGMVLRPEIFTYQTAKNEFIGECVATDMVTAYAKDFPVTIVPQSLWIPVGKPDDIITAEARLCPDKKR